MTLNPNIDNKLSKTKMQKVIQKSKQTNKQTNKNKKKNKRTTTIMIKKTITGKRFGSIIIYCKHIYYNFRNNYEVCLNYLCQIELKQLLLQN